MKQTLRFIILASVVFVSRAALAETVSSIGTTANYQLSTNGRTYETVRPISFRAGYRFRWADVYGEYSYVNSSTGGDLVTVGLANHEFILWTRKFDPTARNFRPFLALGAGFHYQVVTTKFSNETSRDPGLMEAVAAAATGIEIRLAKNIELSLEARATAAESYSPALMFGVGGYFNLLL